MDETDFLERSSSFVITIIVFVSRTSGVEYLAILACSFIFIVSVLISMNTLDLYKLGSAALWRGTKDLIRGFLKKPLMIKNGLLPETQRIASQGK